MNFLKSIKAYLASFFEYEMPKYEVIDTLENNVEIRRYAATKWVDAKMDGVVTDDEVSSDSGTMFRKLFRYISGNNSENQKISMTVPVTINYESKDNKEIIKNSSCVMSMSFYVPAQFSNDTPQPTGDNMSVKEIPEMIVAASRFSGYAKIDDFMQHREIIIKALGAEEVKNYDTINLLTAVYDAPFKPIFRRNEVWVRKNNK